MLMQTTDYMEVPYTVQDLVASKIALADLYMLVQTDENEYTALVYNPFSKNCVEYVIWKEGNSFVWHLESREGAEWAYSVSNECYAYSNMGIGTELRLPVFERMDAFASAFICVTLMFAILFKSVLFPCLLGRKKK